MTTPILARLETFFSLCGACDIPKWRLQAQMVMTIDGRVRLSTCGIVSGRVVVSDTGWDWAN